MWSTRLHSSNIKADIEEFFGFGVSFNSFSSPIVKKFVIKACLSRSVGDVIGMEHESINHDQDLVSDELNRS